MRSKLDEKIYLDEDQYPIYCEAMNTISKNKQDALKKGMPKKAMSKGFFMGLGAPAFIQVGVRTDFSNPWPILGFSPLYNFELNDFDATENDWIQVGEDIRATIEKYEHSISRTAG